MIPAIARDSMYYDQNGYPDQSQGYYDSGFLPNSTPYDDRTAYNDKSQSDYSPIAAQERLLVSYLIARETDGVLSARDAEKAVRRHIKHQRLRRSGYLDRRPRSQ